MKKSITVLGLTLLLAACHPGIGTTRARFNRI